MTTKKKKTSRRLRLFSRRDKNPSARANYQKKLHIETIGRFGNYFFVHGWQTACAGKSAEFHYELTPLGTSVPPEFVFHLPCSPEIAKETGAPPDVRQSAGFLHLFWVNDGYKTEFRAESPLRVWVSREEANAEDRLSIEVSPAMKADPAAFLGVLDIFSTAGVWSNRVVLEILPKLPVPLQLEFHKKASANLGWQAAEAPFLASLDKLSANEALRQKQEFYSAGLASIADLAMASELCARLAELAGEFESLSSNLQSEKKELAQKVSQFVTEQTRSQSQLLDFKEENELLLLQLHQVQEELESYFLKNKDLLAERDDLAARLESLTSERDQAHSELVSFQKTAADTQAALETLRAEAEQAKAITEESEIKNAELAGQLDALTSEKSALHAQLATLGTERDQLKKSAGDHSNALTAAKQELEALKAQVAETEKKRGEHAGQLDARTKERDSLTSERDQLKKTVADRASRIAELEAQVADQAERQMQIDEQMARAEAQLEMLKDFMRPSFD